MTDADTADLIRRAATGEEEAFHGLVRRYSAIVFRWAFVLAGDSDEADDIAQAVWIKVHRALAGFRGEAKFTSWLYRIVFNTASEAGRKEQRRSALHPIRDGDGPGDAIEPDADQVDAARMMALVRGMLGDLPPRQRAVFALADLEDRSTAEVAEMLEIAEATVRVTLHNARRAIRARMLKEEPRLIEEHLS